MVLFIVFFYISCRTSVQLETSLRMVKIVNINTFTHIAFRFLKIVGFDPLQNVAVKNTRMTRIVGKLKSRLD